MSSVKRENNNIVLSKNNIILDIEGTTTSITFVKDVLFPYVRSHLETYVKENWDSDRLQAIINALRIQAREDKEKNVDGVIDIPDDCDKDILFKAVIENVLWQMDIDSKAKSLKDLQGLIMEAGYDNGELKGHVYEDFEPNLKLWTELGKAVFIYSSGSVHAQKLLYGHSEKGDLLPYIKGHFDTTVGKKGDPESYKKIIEEISGSPSETVFFTDVPNEAKAAKEAGLLAILVSREGNAPLSDENKQEFQVIKSFSEIEFENTLKKRKVCTDDENNDNKSVESCEVSVNPPKESSRSSPIQSALNMEVQESSNEGKVCVTDKSEVKLVQGDENPPHENQSHDDCDVEMKSTSEVAENIAPHIEKLLADIAHIEREVASEAPHENKSHDDCDVKMKSTSETAENIDSNEAPLCKGALQEKNTSSEELEAKNDKLNNVNKVNADESNVSLEKSQEKVETDPLVKTCESENPTVETITAIRVDKSDKEDHNLNEDLKEQSQCDNSENMVIEKTESTSETELNGDNVVQENDLINEKKQPGSSQVSIPVDTNTNKTTVIDEKPCLEDKINTDENQSNKPSSQDLPTDNNIDNMVNGKADGEFEGIKTVNESTKHTVNSVEVKLKEESSCQSETKKTDNVNSDSVTPDAEDVNYEDSDANKDIEVNAEQSENIIGKSSVVDEQKSMESVVKSDLDKDQSDNESCVTSEKDSNPNDSVIDKDEIVDLEKKHEIINDSDKSGQLNSELCGDEKNETSKFSEVNDEKQTDNHANEEIPIADTNNGDSQSKVETTKPVNGNVDQELKNGMDEKSVDEVKKGEIPETSMIPTVVEA